MTAQDIAGSGPERRRAERWAFAVSCALLLLLPACGASDAAVPAAAPASPTASPAPAPPPPAPAPAPDFSALIAAIERSPVPNLHVAIGTGGGTLWQYQKGSFPPNRVTPLASASKLLTSITIMRLVEQGTMRLDDTPHRWLPWWTSSPDDPRSRVTLQQLLSFTSGFNVPEDDPGCIGIASTTTQACARSLYDRGLTSAPGAAFAYGPAHMTIAAAMAEAATGQPFVDLFRQQAGTPAGTSLQTDFLLPSRSNPRLSGGAVSTVEDYARVLTALLDGRLITNINQFTADRTAGLPVLQSPFLGVGGFEWHYALGAWRECDGASFSPRCDTLRLISSPGAFGWTPWVDFDRGYWGIVAMYEPVSGTRASVALQQELQPLIEALIAR